MKPGDAVFIVTGGACGLGEGTLRARVRNERLDGEVIRLDRAIRRAAK